MSTPSRRDVLRAAAAAPIAWGAASGAAFAGWSETRAREVKVPRNVLVLVADDQSRIDLACYGNPKSATPTCDALAAAGVRFERAYTASSICQPSRSALYSGLYPHRNGATGFKPLRDDVPTWPELLKRELCATALIGKRHVDPVAKLPFEFRHDSEQPDFGDARAPEVFAKHFTEFLAQAGERRFCAVLNFADPHRPFAAGGRPSDSRSPDDVWVPPHLFNSFEMRLDLAAYYDATARLELSVAAVLAALAKAGRADDTLVIYTSDNGQPFPFAKTTLYEAGINVPLIVRWPGVVAPGTASTALVSLLDLLPTVLETFGAATPANLDGRSLLPLLRGEDVAPREQFVATHDEHRHDTSYPMRSLRAGRWKYIHNFHPERPFKNSITEVGRVWQSWEREAQQNPALAARVQALVTRPREELYDLDADPFELANLAAASEHEATLKDLRARLGAWLVEKADPHLDEWPFKP